MTEIESILRDLNIEIACAEYSGKNRVSVSIKLLKTAVNLLNTIVEKTEEQKMK